MLLTIAAGVSFAIWVYLAVGRGFFWRMREEAAPDARSHKARVVAVVPARNESEVISEAVRSLLTQDYPIDVIVVDDDSNDGTAHLARDTAAECRASER